MKNDVQKNTAADTDWQRLSNLRTPALIGTAHNPIFSTNSQMEKLLKWSPSELDSGRYRMSLYRTWVRLTAEGSGTIVHARIGKV